MSKKHYYVYILGNGRGTLYVGYTDDLERRLYEHKAGAGSRFTSQYGVDQLLFFEEFGNAHEAKGAENRIKGWTRKKKLALVRKMNPKFRDLSEDW